MEGAVTAEALERKIEGAMMTKPHSSAFAALTEANERLHALITSLEQRLDTVLRPPQPLLEEKTDHAGSPLDYQVETTIDAGHRIGRLIDRLAV